MANMLNTGVAALRAFQSALATTSHNVANVGTEGYSRQRAELVSVPPVAELRLKLGNGVTVRSINRLNDQFLDAQLRDAASGSSQAQAFTGLAQRLDDLVGGAETGLTAPLNTLFGALHAVAEDPSSTSQREVLLADARTLADSYRAQDARLRELDATVDSNIGIAVQDINGLADSIAQLNGRIADQSGDDPANRPNDLLDQRDRDLLALSELVDIQVVADGDALNVFIGSGQALVLGTRSAQLSTGPSAVDPTRSAVFLKEGQGRVDITASLSGGLLGGNLDFRRDLLDPASNKLGRNAIALADSYNAQHREGQDLLDGLGGDFFAVGQGSVYANGNNSGSAQATVAIENVAELTASDYELRFQGDTGQWRVTRLSDGETGSAAGPEIRVDGLLITVSGQPADGDSLLVKPTFGAAREFSVLIRDTTRVAAALPIRTAADPVNRSGAVISAGEVLDVTDPSLRDSVDLVFNEPPDSFDVINVASGAILQSGVPYVDGGDIDINGWRVQIRGTPAAGERFRVEANRDGVGDNGNALLLAELQTLGVLDDGSAGVQEDYGALVGFVGAQTRRAQALVEAQQAVLADSVRREQQVSGVNLDEEAANLVRFQQAYEAAARVIAVSDRLFASILAVVRR